MTAGGVHTGARERLAAAAALTCVAAAGLLAVVGIIGSWRAVVLALVALAAVVAGGWHALARRGPARIAGLVVVAGGVALLVVAVLAADLTWWRAGLVFAFAVAAAAAARFALHRTPQELGRRAVPRAAPPPAAHPVLIMNLKSGGGKAERFHLEEECRLRGIEPVVLRPGDDLVALAEDAIARGADVIGMAGGDGSQALVATVASRHDVPHVVVPAGTRNHFALDLGLDREDVVGALEAFRDGTERRIDLATVNGRVFVNNASLGLYATIVRSPEYRDAKRRTAAAMLPDLIGPDATPLDLRFAGPDGVERPTAHVILVSNNPYQLDEIGGRGTRERIDLGVLGVLAARIGSAAQAERFVALDAIGQVRRFPGWLEWSVPEFRVDSGAPVPIGIDGEALTLDPPLRFASVPGALRVRIPKHARGVSPAATRMSTSMPAELWRVLAGAGAERAPTA